MLLKLATKALLPEMAIAPGWLNPGEDVLAEATDADKVGTSAKPIAAMAAAAARVGDKCIENS